MGKIRDLIIKPTKRRPCEVTALDGETILQFDLRLLSADETVVVEREARAFAKANGVEKVEQSDGLYLRGLAVCTILLACTDNESPIAAPEPFFENAVQVRRFLDDARIAYVYEKQRAYQSEFSPTPDKCTYEEFVKLVWAARKEAQQGGDPERPFAGLPYRKLTDFAQNAALVLTTPTLPELLFGSQTPAPSPDDSPSSSPSVRISAAEDSSTEQSVSQMTSSPTDSVVVSGKGDEQGG